MKNVLAVAGVVAACACATPSGAATQYGATIGDSVLAGYYLADRYHQNFGYLALSSFGIQEGPTAGSAAWNFAVGGYTAANEVSVEIPEYEKIPVTLGVVVVDAGSNEALDEPHDTTSNGQTYGTTGYFPLSDYLADAASEQQLIDDVATSAQCPPTTCTIVVKTVRDFLITAPGQYRTLDAYYVDPINKYIRSIYQRLALTHRAVLMQTDATACGSACTAPFVNAYENPANYRPQDGVHPTLAGHEAWAQQLEPLLAPFVSAGAITLARRHTMRR